MDIAKRDAAFIAPHLFNFTKNLVECENTSYWHVFNVEHVLKTLYKHCYNIEKPDEGYNRHSFEYNRRKYLLVGFLTAKLPDETAAWSDDIGLTGTKLRIKAENLNFSADQLEEWIADLFFILDCEDF